MAGDSFVYKGGKYKSEFLLFHGNFCFSLVIVSPVFLAESPPFALLPACFSLRDITFVQEFPLVMLLSAVDLIVLLFLAMCP